MNRAKLILYLSAWAVYAAFCFLAFPQLKISVMLFSIPLTTLAAWLYAYRGAWVTTLLTTLLHYLVLNYHSDDPGVILEAFNPFGIGIQLCFGLTTALLRTTRLRYEQLNAALGNIVKERTERLSQLTDYLIQDQDTGFDLLASGVMEEPIRQLNHMLATATLLSHNLETEKQPGAEIASSVATQLDLCQEQLQALQSELPKFSRTPEPPGHSILQLARHIKNITGETTEVLISGNWNKLDPALAEQIYPIIHEAATNAFRHAAPSLINIGMQINPGAFVVYVENNGKPLPSESGEGMGIPLMRYRAMKFGGTISIRSEANQHTRVQCVIPRHTEPTQKAFTPRDSIAITRP